MGRLVGKARALLTCSLCSGKGRVIHNDEKGEMSTPCIACNGTGKQRYIKARRKRRAKVRPIRMSKLRKDVSATNRGLDAVIRAIEDIMANELEMQRRLQKLETRLRLHWVPDSHYDGEYKAL